MVATINPVPAFSSSKGLLAVEAYYPNSTASDGEESRDGDGVNQKSSILPRIVLSERGHEEGDRQYNHAKSAAYWDQACACYKSRQATTRPSTRYASTTFTTTTATGLITITPSNRPTLQPRPTSRPDPGGENDDGGGQAESQEIEVNPGDFAALYLGITGACLQRRSGVLVCTSNSL